MPARTFVCWLLLLGIVHRAAPVTPFGVNGAVIRPKRSFLCLGFLGVGPELLDVLVRLCLFVVDTVTGLAAEDEVIIGSFDICRRPL